MNPPPSGLAVQVAVLANQVETLRRDVESLRGEVNEMLNEAELRDLAREVLRTETAGTTTTRDNVMRLVTFSVSIGTAVFVIRGGR